MSEQKCCQGQLGNTSSEEGAKEVNGRGSYASTIFIHPQPSALAQELHAGAGRSKRTLADQETLGRGSIALAKI